MGAGYGHRIKKKKKRNNNHNNNTKKQHSPFYHYFCSPRNCIRKRTNRTGTVVVKPYNITRSISLQTHKTVYRPDQTVRSDVKGLPESKQTPQQFTRHGSQKSMSTQVFDVSASRDCNDTPVDGCGGTNSVLGVVHKENKQSDAGRGMSIDDHLGKLDTNVHNVQKLQVKIIKRCRELTEFLQVMYKKQIQLEAKFRELQGIHELQRLLNPTEQQQIEEAEMIAGELRSQESSIASSMHAVDVDDADDDFETIKEEEIPID